ncbi:CHASE2 domain-containing protein [Halopseudomonas sp.]|uniref:CHASE2 domain-containing protein n=1 Tax=Halopseudomonas sp. TaxID=2901191 RepID=UPI0030034FEA
MERHRIKNAFNYAFKFVLLTGLMWAMLTFTIFNTGDKLDKYMQDLFNTYLGDVVYPDDHMDSTTVLLLTDQIVDGALDGQWPAPYTFHAAVLDDLLQHRPSAVFIDFYWLNQLKPGSDYLVEVLQDYKSAGIPVYLAATSRKWFEAFWPELVDLATPVSATLALDPSDFISRRYPSSHQDLASAAYAIAGDLTGKPELGESRAGMDIFWGTRKNPRNWAWMEKTAENEQDWVSTLTEGFSSVGTSIPYTTTVFVRDLINPVGETEEAAQAELSDHLQNRVIIYGASLSGIQDHVFTPTRNILPGAYYHAMALDNLLTWGDEYKSDVASSGVDTLPVPLWLFQLFALVPLSMAFMWHFKRTPTSVTQTKPDTRRGLAAWLVKFGFWLLLTVYVLLLSWYQFTVLDLSVAVWIGFLELLGLGVLAGIMDVVEGFMTRLGSAWARVKSFLGKKSKGDSDDQMGNDSFADGFGGAATATAGTGEQPDNRVQKGADQSV